MPGALNKHSESSVPLYVFALSLIAREKTLISTEQVGAGTSNGFIFCFKASFTNQTSAVLLDDNARYRAEDCEYTKRVQALHQPSTRHEKFSGLSVSLLRPQFMRSE